MHKIEKNHLKKIHKISLLVLLLIYPVYKGIREFIWVKNYRYQIAEELSIDLKIDTDIFGFQDIGMAKIITIENLKTKSKLKVSYYSLENNLYFFIDSSNSKTISIVDQFVGQSFYDYSTLKSLNDKDCFTLNIGCGGFDEQMLSNLGKPSIVYDESGFHN